MGVDTFLYLLNHEFYTRDIVPALGRLLHDRDVAPVLNMFEEASHVLAEATRRFEFPWSPLHQTGNSEEFSLAINLIRGYVPKEYSGDLAMNEPGFSVTDPVKVREYSLREKVFSVIVEGLAVPWNLQFPPVHEITQGYVSHLYELSPKFADAICDEVHSRNASIPYNISSEDQLIDRELIAELWHEIRHVSPPDSDLWQNDYFRNLYLLLHEACEKPEYRILAAYA